MQAAALSPTPPMSRPAKAVGRALPGLRQASCPSAARPRLLPIAAAMSSPGPTDEARLSAQVREGRVKSVDARTAGALQKEGWIILDVRPPAEVSRAGVGGAVAVPVYVEEGWEGLGAYLKHASWFGMGGWWLGGAHMKPNDAFLADVLAAIPLASAPRIVVACQKGLRSLAAAEQLARAGYADLAWVTGGLDSAAPGDLTVVGAPDLRYGGIGGLSAALGMTDVQREGRAGGGGPSRTLLVGALALLAADGVWFLATTGRELLEKGSEGP